MHASVRNTSQAARCDRRARAVRQIKPGDCLDLCHLPSLANAANRRARHWPRRVLASLLSSKGAKAAP